jgi:hypothetical protein
VPEIVSPIDSSFVKEPGAFLDHPLRVAHVETALLEVSLVSSITRIVQVAAQGRFKNLKEQLSAKNVQ